MRSTPVLAAVLALAGILVCGIWLPRGKGNTSGVSAGTGAPAGGGSLPVEPLAHGLFEGAESVLLGPSSEPVDRSAVSTSQGAGPLLDAAVAGTLVHPDGTPSRETRVVLVQATSPESRPPKEVARSRTDEEGQFFFEDAPEGELRVLAHENAPGMHRSGWRAESEWFEAPRRDLHLVLDGDHPMRFHVVDDLDRPITEFRVLLRQTGNRPGLRDSWKMPGVRGLCSLRVHPGAFTLIVEADGYGTHFGDVVLAQDSEPLRIVLVRCATIRGTVHHTSGLPVTAFVRADRAGGGGGSARCDEKGRFELQGLLPGDFRVRAAPAWGDRAMLDHVPAAGGTYPLAPGEVLDLALTLPQGAIIEGTVLSKGDPPDRVRIQGAGVRFAVPITDGGHFLADGLGPGRFHVTSLRGEEPVDTLPLVLSERQMRRVVLGGEPQHPMGVHGRVLLPSGEPSEAELYLVAPGWPEGQRIVGRGRAGADGSFRMEPVEQGTYRLVAVVGEDWAAEVTVSHQQPAQDLWLVPCGILRLPGDARQIRCKGSRWEALSVLWLGTASPGERCPWPVGRWEFGLGFERSLGLDGIRVHGSVAVDVVAGLEVEVRIPRGSVLLLDR